MHWIQNSKKKRIYINSKTPKPHGILEFLFPHTKKTDQKTPRCWDFRLWTSSMRWMASSVSKRSASTSSSEAIGRRRHEFSRAFLLQKNVFLFLDYAWKMDGIYQWKQPKRSAETEVLLKHRFEEILHLLGLDKFWVDQALKTSTAGFWQWVAMGNDACSAGIRYESLHCFPAWIPSKCLELLYNFAVKRLSCKHRWVSYSHWG